MQLNPESQAIVDKLNNDQSVTATSTTVGPFDQIAKDVLQTIIENYDQLNSLSGENRANAFVAVYCKLLKERTETTEEEQLEDLGEQIENPEQKVTEDEQWYIHNIECHSIRGIDSYGETFPFSFEGKSNLIYGPNGSGKSSLLGAVIWALTGLAITDASDEKQQTDIHQKIDGTSKGKKIRSNWPVISTLPEANIENITPDSWVTIELKTKDLSNSLYVKRTLSGLEAGSDKDNLKLCKNLEGYGIKSLDLQIGLLAPTILSRKTLENAENIITILSMILGFDVLTDIGNLAVGIGLNRTKYAKRVGSLIEQNWTSLREKLSHLVEPLNENSPTKVKLRDIVSKTNPTYKELIEKKNLVQNEIDNANKNVAEVLGIDPEDKETREGLADKLIEAIAYFEKDFVEVFQSFSKIKYEPEQHNNKTITIIEEDFTAFCEQAKKRITQRINWWKKEKKEGSKLGLKLRASFDYDVSKMECPVCDQSVKNLPIKDELEKLKALDQELQRELKYFFKDLLDELNKVVSEDIRIVSQSFPSQRITKDWQKIKNTFDKRLKGVFEKYNPKIETIQNTLEEIPIKQLVFFDETDDDLLTTSRAFIKACNDSIESIEILKWSNEHFENTRTQLHTLIMSSADTSLLAELSKSKDKASEIKPLNTIKARLDEIIKLREGIAALESQHQFLEKLKSPIDQIKKLIKYAQEKTEEVFKKIKAASDENWKLLYNESPTGLIPSKLVIERGKTIEPLLSKQNYEVAGKYFANAGLQRAIALCFLCALIDKHQGKISFVLFDDPILSLDEDHREIWADRILISQIEKGTQIILATHQYQFKKNCSHDFKSGNIIEFNPRDTKRSLTWQLGGALDRAKDTLNVNWRAVPNLLRKYCESVLMTLQAYSEEDFYNPENLSSSIRRYKKLQKPNPLVSDQRNNIVSAFEKNEIIRVLDPGSHNLTEDDLTKPMVSTCLDLIKKHIEGNFNSELDRLKRNRKKRIDGKVIHTTSSNVTSLIFNNSLPIMNIGRAAARPDGIIVDETVYETKASLQNFACVHVTGNTFDPIARCGQCVLLADSDDIVLDGDLVVGETNENKKFLRRISFNDEYAILYSINPLKITAPLQVDRKTLSLHRVIGILYDPCSLCQVESIEGNEWHPCKNIDPSYFKGIKMIAVEGDSMEPIARKGQNVLVNEGVTPQKCAIEAGGLAVIETSDESIGNEIKRVYPQKNSWIIVSPNPLESYRPDIIPIEKMKKVWPFKGVIFECYQD